MGFVVKCTSCAQTIMNWHEEGQRQNFVKAKPGLWLDIGQVFQQIFWRSGFCYI